MTREELVEQAAGAFRERDADGRVLSSPAWRDLDPDDRRAAFDAAGRMRGLEAASDPEGLSATARAVLARIRHAGA